MKNFYYKEIERTDKLLFICPFCGLNFRALASHTWQVHNIKAKRLRQMFGLRSDYQLITNDLKERHRTLAINSNEGEKLKMSGIKTRYKKGHEGHIIWSPQALSELSRRSKNEN